MRDGVLVVTHEELCDAYKKAWAYGNGTWQRAYFRSVLTAVARDTDWRPPQSLIDEVQSMRADVLSRHE